MPMNPRLLRPLASGFLTDADAIAYVAAVEAADGQKLEKGVALAYESFITGCKADGIWDAIKSSCILAGARTLAGALVPLRGVAPTNNNFVSGDYDRETGLVGNGSNKYLDSNRANNADPQNSNHNAVFVTQKMVVGSNFMGSDGVSTAGGNNLFRAGTVDLGAGNRNPGNGTYPVIVGGNETVGLKGASRSGSASITLRSSGTNLVGSHPSQPPTSENIAVFARTPSSPTLFADARLAFYSIGESLDLAALDNRVSSLITAIGAAL